MNTRERILSHSFNLFMKRGYTSVNISHILDDLNLSRGGFYHHFKNKEEVLKEVMEKYYIEQLNYLTDIVESARNFQDIIIGIEELAIKQMDTFINIEEERPNHYYLMFEAMKLFPEMKEFVSRWYVESTKKLIQFIKICVESGEIRNDIEPSMLALQIITQVEGIFLMSHFVSENIGKEEVFHVFDKIYNNVKYAS